MTALAAALAIQRARILATAHEPRADRVMSAFPSPPLPGIRPRQLFQPVTAQAARLRKHGETQ